MKTTQNIKTIPFLSVMFFASYLFAVPGNVITEDAATDSGLPYAVVDGDLIVEDTYGNNSETPGLFVEGLSELHEGLILKGMDVIPLYASGGAYMSANQECKIVLGEQNITSYVWGLSVLTINRSTGAMLSYKEYSLWAPYADYDKIANDLNALQDGSVIVVITSTFVWSIGWYDFHEELFKQLQRMGASSQIHDQCYIGENPYPLLKNYVLIGIPGIGAGNGIEVINEDAPESPISPITNKTAEVITLLIKAGSDGKYVPLGLGNSEALNDAGDGVFQRIGIGIQNPQTELDVVGSVNISGDLTIDGSINSRLAISQGSLGTEGIATDTDGNSGIASPSDNVIALAINGAERDNVDASGNVGIDTNTPSTKLDVAGASSVAGDLNVEGALSIGSSTIKITDPANPQSIDLSLLTTKSYVDGAIA